MDAWTVITWTFAAVVICCAVLFVIWAAGKALVPWTDREVRLTTLSIEETRIIVEAASSASVQRPALPAPSAANVVEIPSAWSMRPDNPRDVITFAMLVYLRSIRGEKISVEAMTGAHFLGSRRVGDVTNATARTMLARLSELGMLSGRKEGATGALKVKSADDVLSLLERNATSVEAA